MNVAKAIKRQSAAAIQSAYITTASQLPDWYDGALQDTVFPIMYMIGINFGMLPVKSIRMTIYQATARTPDHSTALPRIWWYQKTPRHPETAAAQYERASRRWRQLG